MTIEQYVGLDVSLKETHFRVMDAAVASLPRKVAEKPQRFVEAAEAPGSPKVFKDKGIWR